MQTAGLRYRLLERISAMKKGTQLPVKSLYIKEGETSPAKALQLRFYHTGKENAGQLIEDEELRAQIKGSGIGTSATRAGNFKKISGK